MNNYHLICYLGLVAGLGGTIFGTIEALNADDSRLRRAWATSALFALALFFTKLSQVLS